MKTLDGFGTARMMIRLYGMDAQNEARRRCDEALTRDDTAGFERWAHIATMIGVQIARSEVPPPQPFH